MGEEVIRQQLDVLASLAQRRQRDREDIQPVVEILAQPAVLYQLRGVAVRGRDHTHVHGHALGAAHAEDPAGLEHAQQLAL
jgi:hypothetical protein